MAEKLPKATHSGYLEFGGATLPCFVLENGTRVISGRGMTKAIGMKGRGQGVVRIATHSTLNPYISNELKVAIENPIRFIGSGSRKANPTAGYEATILHSLCEAILNARDDDALKTEQEKRYAQYCDAIIRSIAKVGIIALVDEATGYQEIRDRNALQKILDKYLRQELAAWAKRFPDEFYEQMFRLRNWQWKGMKVNRPQIVANYTKDLVYERLAPGILAELEARNPVGEKGHRRSKHHQWLTDDVGHPALAQHLYAIIGFMRASANWPQLYRMVQRAFPRINTNLELLLPEPEEKE